MPAKGFLTETQREKLQNVLKESDCPVLTQHILMLLLRERWQDLSTCFVTFLVVATVVLLIGVFMVIQIT